MTAQALMRAVELHQKGKLDEAEGAYRNILKSDPRQFDALHLLGVILLQKGDAAGAAAQIGAAVKINPAVAAAQTNLGNALRILGRGEEALAAYDRASTLEPTQTDALVNKGITLKAMGRLQDALNSYDRAAQLQPKDPNIWYNRGNVLGALKKHADAVDSYNKAVALNPKHSHALRGIGNALVELQRPKEALDAFDRAVAIDPNFAEAHNNRAILLRNFGRLPEAIDAVKKAVALKPDYAMAHNNLGNMQLDQRKFGDAAQSYARALQLDPACPYAEGMRLYSRLFVADWQNYDADTAALLHHVRAGKPATLPFPLVALPATAEDQFICAKAYAAAKHPPQPPLWKGEKYKHDKIRIAYLSADLQAHATAYLMAGMFELHDKSKFDVSAISFGRDDGGGMRARLAASFTQFIDASNMSDAEVAQWLRKNEIDIAVDLKGYTQDNRTGIFAHRAAPVQVNYIGYPGTMGAPYMDYILADKTILPDNHLPFYTEKAAWLPGCYQPNDRKRVIADKTPTRAEAGLPDSGFVFCSFNNGYKITPQVFDIWMQLLKQVDASVLWLLDSGGEFAANIKKESQKRGIDPARLCFAPRTKLEDHLARHRLADLFLDTLPCNAHTTASDALWAGLPLVTCTGETFAGRVAASLLNAAGLPELVTQNLADYEALALSLARDPAKLAAIKTKLAAQRDACALFDTAQYTRNVEAAYMHMWKRAEAGSPPESFTAA